MSPDLLLALALAPLALAATAGLVRRPLTVALPAFAATLPFGGLLSVGSSRFTTLSSLLGLVLVIGLLLHLAVGERAAGPMSPTVRCGCCSSAPPGRRPCGASTARRRRWGSSC